MAGMLRIKTLGTQQLQKRQTNHEHDLSLYAAWGAVQACKGKYQKLKVLPGSRASAARCNRMKPVLLNISRRHSFQL